MLVFMTIPSLVQSIDVKRQGTFENRFFSFFFVLSQSLSLPIICVGREDGHLEESNCLMSEFYFYFRDVFDRRFSKERERGLYPSHPVSQSLKKKTT